jgi:sucrose-6-phosphate hydrolase SacC (GH32 family)
MIARREFPGTRRFLNVPIKIGAGSKPFRIFCEGNLVRQGTLELAGGEPDFWTFIDLEFLRGRAISIDVEALPAGSRLLEGLEMADEIKGAWALYREPGRPQFHLTPRRGWIGDPNGLVHFNGEYHAFFQHTPFALGMVWGGICWGHAVSRDLVHWQELDCALFPDEFGCMCSGTAVVDHENASGLGIDGRPPLLLFFTAAREEAFVQGMAYSTDGRIFHKCPWNPVVPQIRWGNRDPKVLWDAATRRWVMVLYTPGEPDPCARDEAGRPLFRYEVHFLTSPDLREWKTTHIFPGGFGNDFAGIDRFLFECVDLYPLHVDGDPARRAWVLQAANGEYVTGGFDGTKFVADGERKRPGYPELFYAGQTFSNAPEGRCIRMGFLRAQTPGMPFNQCLTVPHELSLRQAGDGLRLHCRPVLELESLRKKSTSMAPGLLAPGQNAMPPVSFAAFDLEMEIEPRDARWIVLEIKGACLVYDVLSAELITGAVRVPLARDGRGRIALRILADTSCLEVFGGDGLVYLPVAISFAPSSKELSLTAAGGTAEIHRLVVHEMSSIWL